MDGVDKELSRDPGFLFVLTKAEEAQSGDDNDRRIGIAKFGGLAGGPLFVILLIAFTLASNLVMDAVLKGLNVFFGRIPTDEPRTDSCSQEVVGTTGSKRAQFLDPLRSGKG